MVSALVVCFCNLIPAIGLLWNVTDYISRHHQRISDDLAARSSEDGPFDCNGEFVGKGGILYIYIYYNLN